jgi:SnoaL-like domain
MRADNLAGEAGRMAEAEQVLRSSYNAFNARNIEAAVELMDSEVDWPNAWEGGRVVGRAAVRDYWNRQFAASLEQGRARGLSPRRQTGASRSMSIKWSTTPVPAS